MTKQIRICTPTATPDFAPVENCQIVLAQGAEAETVYSGPLAVMVLTPQVPAHLHSGYIFATPVWRSPQPVFKTP
ncbi:hypothetical protein [Yoonia sp. MH D7]